MNETIDFYSFEVVVKLKTSAINTNGKIDILCLFLVLLHVKLCVLSYIFLYAYKSCPKRKESKKFTQPLHHCTFVTIAILLQFGLVKQFIYLKPCQ